MTIPRLSSLFVVAVLLVASLCLSTTSCISAFTNPGGSLHRSSCPVVSGSVLNIGNLLGSNKQESSSKGGTTVFDIQAKNIKVGGLRFFLNIYLVGQCNTPEQGTWLVRQDDDGKLDLYFKDGTGMLSLRYVTNWTVVFQ